MNFKFMGVLRALSSGFAATLLQKYYQSWRPLGHPFGLCLVGIASLALIRAAPSFAGPMDIGGQLGVNERGAAGYTIPLQGPPGIAGIKPNLALSYNSQSGNGMLGLGWSLQGLSAITHCPQTVAQDGAKGGVNYDSSDRYCLDGQRLMGISGTYGADGAEYRTERDSFAKIISYSSAGNAPAWFKVWTKSGQILEYGNTSDSRIEAIGVSTPRAWAVNKISDTVGNYLTVAYNEDTTNGDFTPDRIDYTANGSQAATNSVRFTYESRTDSVPMYQAGSIIKATTRLTNVKAYVGSTAIKNYVLAYSYGSVTGQSKLASITECIGDASTCLPATSFTWPSETHGLGAWNNAATSHNPGCDEEENAGPNVGPWALDINGDGKSDLLWLARPNGGGDCVIVFALSTGTTFSAPTVTSIVAWPEDGLDGVIRVGDFNGDGKMDRGINARRH